MAKETAGGDPPRSSREEAREEAETATPTVLDEKAPEHHTAHLENGVLTLDDGKRKLDAHNSAGLAVIEQRGAIPTTGRRIPTTKWEYISFCIFCKSSLFLKK